MSSVKLNEIQEPGEFQLLDARLKTSTGLNVDIAKSIVGITIFEDLFSSTISGSIAIQDSINLASVGPLIGQEYLFLKLKTPNLVDQDAAIDFSTDAFIVYNIGGREDVGNGVQVYILSFVSQELIKDQRTKVKKSLVGPFSDIVESMLTNQLQTKKKIVIEPTAGVKKIVSPNLRPFDVIKMASKQSVSRDTREPTYVFYESLKGFNFRSLASLYNQETKIVFNKDDPSTNVSNRGIDVEAELRNILEFEISSVNDSLVNYRTGMFASTMITHDIISKTYSTKIYNYLDEYSNETHIDKHPIVNDLPINKRGERVSDFPARTFVIPTSLSGSNDSQHDTLTGNQPYAAYDPQRWLQRRNSQLIQLESGLNVNILIHGNTLLTVGDIVELNIPFTSSSLAKYVGDGEQSTVDKLFRKNFLIKRIRHEFDTATSPFKHQMYVNLVRDGLDKKLESPEDNFEPESLKSGGVEEYEYNSYPK